MLKVLLGSQHALRASASRLVHRGASYGLLQKCLNTTSRCLHEASLLQHESATISDASIPAKSSFNLPLTCPGCGAPSQTIDSSSAGFFREKHERKVSNRREQENAVFDAAAQRGDLEVTTSNHPPVETSPICDRCHYLLYQSHGRSIIHPTTDAIRAIIEESPHRHNHIYHILDAADFPMSLIPNLSAGLHLPRLRTQNRRSKSVRYMRDRVAEISFIVTRSDLLAPKKEQVDKLLPYIQEVLRDALGRTGKNVRLGNVRLVSSKRGWWTKTVKEEIYRRGGAGWMVGKVNVGKSALVEVVYPKGRLLDRTTTMPPTHTVHDDEVEQIGVEDDEEVRDTPNQTVLQSSVARSTFQGQEFELSFDEVADPAAAASETLHAEVANNDESRTIDNVSESSQHQEILEEQTNDDAGYVFDESELSLLPPPQPEVAYPVMPIVSALPGTTASPIRLPFGSGKGELIDLPGIERSTLETFIKEESRKDMVMKHRVVPEQQSVKPGQSLLLGGLIRITPKTDDLVFLVYAFLPTALNPHVTSTEKATAIQTGTFTTGEAYEGNVSSNATETARISMKSAGTFKLRWDVTKQRSGPVTDKAAGKMKPSNLPYIVYSLDLLVEGVGWVEIVAQVRRKRMANARPFSPFTDEQDSVDEVEVPEIEVFSPNGQFIGVRRPMNGWMMGGPKKPPVHARRPRPRQSISYQRRMEGGRLGGAKRSVNDT